MADLITTASLKSFLGITVATHDTVLGEIITGVSSAIENYIERTIAETAYANELYDGDGSSRLYLNNFPIYTSPVLTLEYWNTVSQQVDIEYVEHTDYEIYHEEGYIYKSSGFRRGHKNYQVNYTAGYAATPEDLALAVKQICGAVYNGAEKQGIQAYRIGTFGETFGVTLNDMFKDLEIPGSTISTIERYRYIKIH